MPDLENRQYLEFEKPIKDLGDQIIQLKAAAAKNKIDLDEPIRHLDEKILEKRKEITESLTNWQKVQLRLYD